MKISIEINNSVVEKTIQSMMENLPEASTGCALRCTGWNYKSCTFTFIDEEQENKSYKIGMVELLKAFPLLFTDKWPKGCTPPPMSANPELWDEWLCRADATDFDAFAQLACLGEVIYG